jgi:GTPase SAR1 family protein
MKKKEAQSKHDSGNPSQYLVKLISVGDVEVGKSCLIKRYCEGHFILE